MPHTLKKSGRFLAGVLMLGLVLSQQSALAQFGNRNDADGEDDQREDPAQRNIFDAGQSRNTRIDRRQAAELARESNSGRVLSIRLDEGKWRVRMDQDGTVFNLFVDASSGEVSRTAEDPE